MGHMGLAIAQPQVKTSKLTLEGKMMDERANIFEFVRSLRSSELAWGKQFVDVKRCSLGDWKEAIDVSATHTGMGKGVVITP